MRASFPGAEVEDYEGLNRAMSCHPKDAHILAAAVRANAELIVTFNLSDFPVTSLKPYEIDAVHPDDFLLDQLDLYPERTLSTLHEQSLAYQDPNVTLHELLARLERTGLPRFVERVLKVLSENENPLRATRRARSASSRRAARP